ncbi:MAG: M4 family metallopeptidase [Bacteroidota bacterium]
MRQILPSILIVFGLCLSANTTIGQQTSQPTASSSTTTDWLSIPTAQQKLTPDLFFRNQQNTLGLSQQDDMRLVKEETDRMGFRHHRFAQYHNGVRIEGAQYLVHQREGLLLKANGQLVRNLALSTQASISEEAAIAAALRLVGANTYMWQDKHLALSLREVHQHGHHHHHGHDAPSQAFYPDPELVIFDPSYSQQADQYRLAYKMDIYASQPFSRQWVFIDALTGNVLARQERIHSENVEGTAVTRYSGEQQIVADSVGPGEFRLRETARGAGADIVTLNLERNDRDETDMAVDFLDADNFWNNFNLRQDEVATDAHWGAEQTYDLMLNQFGRNSIDDEGHELRSYVHLGRNLRNAFWTGEAMFYGDGGGNTGPFISIDIVAHEVAHGLTQNTAGLIYQDESGALNESFSDIFGVAVKFYSTPDDFNWRIGDKIYDNNSGLRSMEAPNAFNHPDTYLGQFWFRGDGDNGGVHTNSGVQNFWFYLLAEGGEGTNDRGMPFEVQGLGMDKALQVTYRNLAFYLTPSSNHLDAREGAIQAAIDLYGDCSEEVASVIDAWAAVGVGTPFSRRDLQPNALEQPTFVCGRSQEKFSVAIDHIACNTEIPAGDTVFFSYQIDQQTPIVEPWVVGSAIEASSSFRYEFQEEADLSTIGFYDLRIWVHYPGDNNNGNDTLIMRIENRADQNEDWAVLAINSPAPYQCDYTESETVNITAAYYGCEILAAGTRLPISFQLNDGSTITEIFALSETVDPDGLVNLTFDAPVDLTTEGFNNLLVSTVNPGDNWTQNDGMTARLLNGIDRPEGVTLRFEDELSVSDSTFIRLGSESEIWRDTASVLNGQYGLRITGGDPISSEDNSLLITLPSSEEEAWELNTDYISEIEYCVDANDWESIRLTFNAQMTYAGTWGSILRGVPMFRYAARFRLLIDGEPFGETYHPGTGEHILGRNLFYDIDLSEFAGQAFTLTFQTQVFRNASYDINSISSDGDNIVLDNILLEQFPRVSTTESDLSRSLQVFPNPANDFLTVSMDLTEGANLRMELVNVLGQSALSLTESDYPAGQSRTSLQTGHLPAGVYWLVIHNGQQRSERRVVISR